MKVIIKDTISILKEIKNSLKDFFNRKNYYEGIEKEFRQFCSKNSPIRPNITKINIDSVDYINFLTKNPVVGKIDMKKVEETIIKEKYDVLLKEYDILLKEFYKEKEKYIKETGYININNKIDELIEKLPDSIKYSIKSILEESEQNYMLNLLDLVELMITVSELTVESNK